MHAGSLHPRVPTPNHSRRCQGSPSTRQLSTAHRWAVKKRMWVFHVLRQARDRGGWAPLRVGAE